MTGTVTGFLLSWLGLDGYGVYVSGDTIPFEGTDEGRARAAPVGVALLNLGRVQLTPEPGPNFSSSEREMWTAAAEARERRLDEVFAATLRPVFIDERGTAAAFEKLAVRDGIEARHDGCVPHRKLGRLSAKAAEHIAALA